MARAIASKAPRQAEKPRPAPARAAPTPAPGPGVGSALPAPVSSQISGSLGVDVSAVRVHSDAGASGAAGMLSSRAFAYGSHVYLGPGERPTDIGLMAHEVAHSVQQGGAPRLQLWTPDGGDRHEHEAQAASRAVQSRSRFSIRERTRPRTQRWGLGSILDWIADKANIIPGFRMFTIVLGVNPINMSAVDRSAANILRAIVEFIPGGGLIVMALDNYGVFEKAGKYVETQLRTLGISGSMIKNALMTFLDSLGLSDILHPGRVWDRAKKIFTDPITRIITFVKNLAAAILTFIRDAILKPLAALAANTRGYDLLKAVLGKDPITGEPVPRTADTLIGGFMKLIGQEEVWQNLKKARAVDRAWSWFQGVISGLMGFVRQIPSLFINTLKSLEISDLVIPPKAFVKVVKAFGGFVGQFFSWGFNQVIGLLQIIFEVLAPGAMPYIRKAAGAFKTIVKNPIGFIGNLVRAGIQGFRQFGSRFITHLKKSLIQWLTGTLAGSGIYVPAGFDLKEIIKFVLSVLGLTWANIRSKLLRVIPEPAVVALERGFDIVQTLVRHGPAAAWDKIKEAISDLKGMVIDGIMGFVKSRIVEAAITKLVTSLNPAGAFIQAVIAIYNTVMFFVERLRQIAQVAMSFIDSIAAIASGAIGAAANKVEQTMGGLLTLVISFLARLVGLGKVSDAVKNIVNKVRAPIDKALDRVVAWIVATARRLGKLVAGNRDAKTVDQQLDAALAAATALMNQPDATVESVRAGLPAIQRQHKLTTLRLIVDAERDDLIDAHFDAQINPLKTKKVKKPRNESKKPLGAVAIPREKMRWLKPDKIEIGRAFKKAVGKGAPVTAAGVIKTKKKYGRRHIVSFADMADHYTLAFNKPAMTVGDAIAILKKFKGFEDVKPTKKAVRSKILSLVRRAFSWHPNVRIGDQAVNSSIGRTVDEAMLYTVGPTIQAKIDAHVQTFLVEWAIPGVKFTLTQAGGVTFEWTVTET